MWFNPFMVWLIRSPFHHLLSKNFMTITYKGRKSGKSYQLPVNYTRQGDTLLTFSYRDRTWWRNFRGSRRVVLRLEGEDVSALSQVVENDAEVTEALDKYLSETPHMAKYFQVRLDPTGAPISEDIRHTVADRVVIVSQVLPARN
jgi:deazaflavin-dependent oxidoreductase (nitroreductase family)